MKKLILTSALCLTGLIGFSQVDQNTTQENKQESTQDRLQQQPPRPAQSGVDRAARQAGINEQNNQNVISAEEKMQSEKERSTGKPDNNPALTNPKTVRPVRIADPVSNPGQN